MGKTKTVVIGETPKEDEKLKKKQKGAPDRKELERSTSKTELKSATTKEKASLKTAGSVSVQKSPAAKKQIKDSRSKDGDKTEAVKEIKQKSSVKNLTESKKRQRSKRYKLSRSLRDYSKVYGVEEAIEVVKKISYSKFDATIDLHFKTVSKKNQEPIRGMVTLPAGAPKKKRVVIADDSLLQLISRGKIDFDILLAKPEMMPKLARVAKILGPKGLMPSPKSGTVVDDPDRAKKELEKGKLEYKTDALGNVHIPVGKVSWANKRIKQNIEAVVAAVPSNRVEKMYLAPSMGASVRIR